MRRVRIHKLTILAAVALLTLAIGSRLMFVPPVPYEKMERVSAGMSREQVQAFLGPPTKTNSARGLSGEEWFYRRPFTLGEACILFTTNGTVGYATYTP